MSSRKPLPSMRSRWGSLLGLLTVVLGAAAWTVREPVWAAFRTHPYFRIETIALRGQGPLLSREEILDWLGLRGGANIWDVPPMRVRARLELHPLIKHASVHREFPNRFEIQVQERRPLAIVVLDGMYYLARDGRPMLRLDKEHDVDFPVISGLTAETPPGYRAWALRAALRLIRLCDRMDCLGGLSEVRVDPALGMVVYPARARTAVVLGRGSWRTKLERAQQVLSAWDPASRRLSRIDTRFRNQLVVRLRSEPGEPPKARPKGRHIRT